MPILTSHAQDLDTKRRIVRVMSDMAAIDDHHGHHRSNVTPSSSSPPPIQQQLHVLLATWLLSPHLHADADETVLHLVKDEMRGF